MFRSRCFFCVGFASAAVASAAAPRAVTVSPSGSVVELAPDVAAQVAAVGGAQGNIQGVTQGFALGTEAWKPIPGGSRPNPMHPQASPGPGSPKKLCTMPMWGSESYVCKEHDQVTKDMVWKDKTGEQRKAMKDEGLCTVTCPKTTAGWQQPDVDVLECQDGEWVHARKKTVMVSITCNTADYVYWIMFLFALAAFGYYLSGRKQQAMERAEQMKNTRLTTAEAEALAEQQSPVACIMGLLFVLWLYCNLFISERGLLAGCFLVGLSTAQNVYKFVKERRAINGATSSAAAEAIAPEGAK